MDVSQTTLLSARGILDERGQLLSADQSLSDLQARCGGSIPGMLAVPELLDLCSMPGQLDLLLREVSQRLMAMTESREWFESHL